MNDTEQYLAELYTMTRECRDDILLQSIDAEAERLASICETLASAAEEFCEQPPKRQAHWNRRLKMLISGFLETSDALADRLEEPNEFSDLQRREINMMAVCLLISAPVLLERIPGRKSAAKELGMLLDPATVGSLMGGLGDLKACVTSAREILQSKASETGHDGNQPRATGTENPAEDRGEGQLHDHSSGGIGMVA